MVGEPLTQKIGMRPRAPIRGREGGQEWGSIGWDHAERGGCVRAERDGMERVEELGVVRESRSQIRSRP